MVRHPVWYRTLIRSGSCPLRGFSPKRNNYQMNPAGVSRLGYDGRVLQDVVHAATLSQPETSRSLSTLMIRSDGQNWTSTLWCFYDLPLLLLLGPVFTPRLATTSALIHPRVRHSRPETKRKRCVVGYPERTCAKVCRLRVRNGFCRPCFTCILKHSG